MNQIQHSMPRVVIRHADPVVVLVTAHLHLESVVIGMIEVALPKPKALDTSRINFPMKVNLAVALGIFPEQAVSGVLSINRIRNRFAHRLDATISAGDVDSLAQETAFLDAATTDGWITLPPANQIGWIASLLQAYLFGVYDSLRNFFAAQDEAAVRARALELYPEPPVDSSAEASSAGV